MNTRVAIVGAWLIVMAACGAWLYRSLSITTDLTIFLPPSATPAQHLLITQLREGVASRLMLIALHGEEPAALARVSANAAMKLQATGLFSYVANGDPRALEKERAILFQHRYVLSPAVSAERFTAEGLEAALRNSLALLSSPAGVFVRSTLADDPTGEMLRLVRTLTGSSGPQLLHGVWFSRDERRALLLAETAAAGFDVDAQRKAVDAVDTAVRESGARDSNVTLAGAGVFAAQMRETIRTDARNLTVVTIILVLAILYSVYRSALMIGVSALPVLSGLVAGMTAVSTLFGSVHGITLGFGATLIGEAVDYPAYLLLQSVPGESLKTTLARIWPTLRLAILTTIFGAFAMALSSFTGLAQLGALTIAGVLAAGLVTRWVVPAIVAHGPVVPASTRQPAIRLLRPLSGSLPRRVALMATLLALGVIVWRHDRLWDDELANLSPIPEASKAMDRALRQELGAPDVRYLVVARGADREAALQASEAAAAWLRDATERGWISGFEVASMFLPSRRTQDARRAALPEPAVLQSRLDQAARDLPFRDGLFAPFVSAVSAARRSPYLDLDDLRGSALGTKVGTLLIRTDPGWAALAPLSGVAAPQELAAAALKAGHELFDLKAESNALVNQYRGHSLMLIALGLGCIALQLMWSLRSVSTAVRILAPVLAAVAIDVAMLLLLGTTLSLFHLVALLLVIGIGLNYALFFQRPRQTQDESRRTADSLVVCAATTLAAFGCLAFSRTPVLHAIGLTVAIGSLLSLILTATCSKRSS